MNHTEIVAPGYLSSEFMERADAFFVPRHGRIFGGCGDDRPLTPESAAALSAQFADLAVLNPAEAYASIYGGPVGIAKTVAIVGMVQDADFLKKVGGLDGITNTLLAHMAQDTSEDAVYFGLHSAEANEKDETGNTDLVSFCTHGDAATGCAYCGGVGATSSILATDSLAQQTARHDQITIFGDDRSFDALIGAHQQLVAAEGPTKAVDRQAYTDLLEKPVAGNHTLPFMMLEGAHTSARKSGVIINLDRKSIGSARKAHDAGYDIYREDVTIAAEVARKAFTEYDLDPELLLRSLILDSTSVRAVLAANDADPELAGKLDPTALAIGVRGSVKRAIDDLYLT